jgi:hypothetical protein
MPWPTDLKSRGCTALSSSFLWLKQQNLSLSRSKVGLRLHLRVCDWGASMRHCVRSILTTFYHMHHYHYAVTGDMVKSFINEFILIRHPKYIIMMNWSIVYSFFQLLLHCLLLLWWDCTLLRYFYVLMHHRSLSWDMWLVSFIHYCGKPKGILCYIKGVVSWYKRWLKVNLLLVLPCMFGRCS